ncbi:MAG: Hpt domain-containing protein [Deltaproteobacteria bacterium]|nr:Hpt domain-containing protein [Deltaproteobacteria bacterium]
MEDDEILHSYVEESLEHLADIENDLLAIEKAGADIDEDLVNSAFRAAHSIKGGAGFLGLNNIKDLAHKIENVMGLIRNREIPPFFWPLISCGTLSAMSAKAMRLTSRSIRLLLQS